MDKLETLRGEYPQIKYKAFRQSVVGARLDLEYDYELSPDFNFVHRVSIDFSAESSTFKISEPSPKLVFLLGVVELISYWKLVCPPRIEIKCGHLSESEISWFKDLYLNGLGEFFYLNQLDPSMGFEFSFDKAAPQLEMSLGPKLEDKSLVMVGGGKDSLVTLRAFKEMEKQFRGFVVNPIPQALDSIKLFSGDEPIRVKRTISPKLLSLPKTKYFNGHIPFSATLAFIGAIASECCGYRHVVTSNESTANEGNIHYQGKDINHQYSKTFEFETKFRELLASVGSGVNYYSFLRPLSELQITGLLSTHEESLATFLSCNRAQTIKAKKEGEHKWCGACPKCVFTFLSLCPFLSIKELSMIWHPLPLKYISFFQLVGELCGLGEHKPFECVGSYEESRTGFKYLVGKMSKDVYFTPILDRANEILNSFGHDFQPSTLDSWDDKNYLAVKEVEYLRKNLKNVSFKE